MLTQPNQNRRTGTGFPENTPFEDQWDHLSQNCLIPAFAHNRIWLTAQSNHLSTANNREIIIADRKQPIAIAGLAPQAIVPLFPLKLSTTWDTGFLFSGTPLLDKNQPEKALKALLSKCEEKHNTKAVFFKKVQQSPDLDQVIEKLSPSSTMRFARYHIHERAALKCTTDYNTWFNKNFSRKRKKEYRRIRNRLSDLGQLVSTTWDSSMPVTPWLDEFLVLEKSGWKGKNGTAIACNKAQEGQLRQAVEQMAQNGSLLFWKITLNGKVIASLFGFMENNQAWLGKMAFDETKSQFSPGVLVILDATKDFLNNRQIELVDSSADADHPMINNIWRDRIQIADVLIATPNTSELLFKVIVTLKSFHLSARDHIKRLYHSFKNRKLVK